MTDEQIETLLVLIQISVMLGAMNITIGIWLSRKWKSLGTAPGSGLVCILSKIYSRKKYEAVFRNAIADMREEYFEALQAGNAKHAKWIWVRGICSIWAAVFADMPVSMINMTVKLWKAAQ